jgi:hypothetical protein
MASGLVVVAAGILLVPRYGLAGVGYGIVAGALVRLAFVASTWRAHFPDVSAGSFAAHLASPAVIAVAVAVTLSGLHDRVAPPPTWPWLLVEGAITLALVAGIQLAASEALPGGPDRRRDVLVSFRPLLARFLRSEP